MDGPCSAVPAMAFDSRVTMCCVIPLALDPTGPLSVALLALDSGGLCCVVPIALHSGGFCPGVPILAQLDTGRSRCVIPV